MAGKKCAHRNCTCETSDGSSYCSERCSEQRDVAGCDCGHPDCRG